MRVNGSISEKVIMFGDNLEIVKSIKTHKMVNALIKQIEKFAVILYD